MNLQSICEGLIAKNYKEMCRLLDEPIKSGKSKVLQMEDWKRYFDFEKQGHKIIINKIYEDVIPRKTKKYTRPKGFKNPYYKKYKNLNIEVDKHCHYGVYKISNSTNIYIGSTKRTFRQRFLEHYKLKSPDMQHTYNLLKEGGKFEILYDMSDIEDVDLIRMVENEFIKYYIESTELNVINIYKSSFSYKETKNKHKNIKVKEENYIQAIQLLVKQGLINIEEVDI